MSHRQSHRAVCNWRLRCTHSTTSQQHSPKTSRCQLVIVHKQLISGTNWLTDVRISSATLRSRRNGQQKLTVINAEHKINTGSTQHRLYDMRNQVDSQPVMRLTGINRPESRSAELSTNYVTECILQDGLHCDTRTDISRRPKTSLSRGTQHDSSTADQANSFDTDSRNFGRTFICSSFTTDAQRPRTSG